jgi:hypothetical protein
MNSYRNLTKAQYIDFNEKANSPLVDLQESATPLRRRFIMTKDSSILVYVKFAGFELRLRYLAPFLKNGDAKRGEESQASSRGSQQGSQVGFIK